MSTIESILILSQGQCAVDHRVIGRKVKFMTEKDGAEVQFQGTLIGVVSETATRAGVFMLAAMVELEGEGAVAYIPFKDIDFITELVGAPNDQ